MWTLFEADTAQHILTVFSKIWQRQLPFRRSASKKRHRRGCPFALSLPSVAAICFPILHFTIYISISNLHSLLILCFIGLAVVSDTIFTKAIYIILKCNSLQAFGLKHGLIWPTLALFGILWGSNTQADPANALAQILSLSSSTGNPPHSKKFLGGVKVVASKSDFLPPPCELLHWEPICHMEGRRHLHTHRPTRIHTMSCWGRGNGWLSPVCKCECVCSEAMQGHSVQLRL